MSRAKAKKLSPEEFQARRVRTRGFLQDFEMVELCLEELADGMPLTQFCAREKYAESTVRHWLASHRPNEYEAVRLSVADKILDEISELEEKLEDAIDSGEPLSRDLSGQYRELLKSKAWRVEKLNPARYGQRQNIDMRVTDTSKMQLEAIRSLSKAKRHTAFPEVRNVIDGVVLPTKAIAAPTPPETDVASMLSMPYMQGIPASDTSESQEGVLVHVGPVGHRGQGGHGGHGGIVGHVIPVGHGGSVGQGSTVIPGGTVEVVGPSITVAPVGAGAPVGHAVVGEGAADAPLAASPGRSSDANHSQQPALDDVQTAPNNVHKYTQAFRINDL